MTENAKPLRPYNYEFMKACHASGERPSEADEMMQTVMAAISLCPEGFKHRGTGVPGTTERVRNIRMWRHPTIPCWLYETLPRDLDEAEWTEIKLGEGWNGTNLVPIFGRGCVFHGGDHSMQRASLSLFDAPDREAQQAIFDRVEAERDSWVYPVANA